MKPPVFESLRLLPYRKSSAAFNMAADSYLFEQSPVPTFRLYGWERPSLSFGKSSAHFFDLDAAFLKQQNFDLVLRPTGGKTVFHHQEWTYAFTFPPDLFPRSILASYLLLAEVLKLALSVYLPELELNTSKSISPDHSNCFLDVSSYEISYQQKKWIGSAQARKKNSLLQHGSILVAVDWPVWARIWQTSPAALQKKITAWQDHGPVPLLADLEQRFQTVLNDFFHTAVFKQDFTPEELVAIKRAEDAWRLQLPPDPAQKTFELAPAGASEHF